MKIKIHQAAQPEFTEIEISLPFYCQHSYHTYKFISESQCIRISNWDAINSLSITIDTLPTLTTDFRAISATEFDKMYFAAKDSIEAKFSLSDYEITTGEVIDHNNAT